MLTGDETITGGEAYVKGCNVAKNIKQVCPKWVLNGCTCLHSYVGDSQIVIVFICFYLNGYLRNITLKHNMLFNVK